MPSPAVLALGVLGGVSAGAVAAPFSVPTAVVVGAVAVVAVVAFLVGGAPVVEVLVPAPEDAETPGTGGELRAGGARIPTSALGSPEVLDAEGMRAALGPELDARAWVCQRSWVRGGVRVPVTDPRDATPCWVLSSRRPAALAAALGQAAHSEQTS